MKKFLVGLLAAVTLTAEAAAPNCIYVPVPGDRAINLTMVLSIGRRDKDLTFYGAKNYFSVGYATPELAKEVLNQIIPIWQACTK